MHWGLAMRALSPMVDEALIAWRVATVKLLNFHWWWCGLECWWRECSGRCTCTRKIKPSQEDMIVIKMYGTGWLLFGALNVLEKDNTRQMVIDHQLRATCGSHGASRPHTQSLSPKAAKGQKKLKIRPRLSMSNREVGILNPGRTLLSCLRCLGLARLTPD